MIEKLEGKYNANIGTWMFIRKFNNVVIYLCRMVLMLLLLLAVNECMFEATASTNHPFIKDYK